MDPEQAKQPDNESPQPPLETSFEPQGDMAIPEPTGSPSSTVASAIEQLSATSGSGQPLESPIIIQSTPPSAKPSRKKLIIGIVIGVAVLAAAGLLWYAFFGSPTKKTSDSNVDQSQSATLETVTPETSSATIDKAVDALTTNSSTETSLSGTDDSQAAADASTATGNVGDSVNEDNF